MIEKFPDWLPPFSVTPFLTPTECAYLIDKAEASGKFRSARVISQDGSKGVREEHCVAQMATFFRGQDIFSLVTERAVLQLEALNRHYQFDLFDELGTRLISNVSVMRYDDESGGKFRPHVDVGGLPGAEFRKVSVIVPLNDPDTYEGGRLLIDTGEQFDATAYTNVGSAISFCSLSMHSVTPVVKGIRYTLVFFLQGPHFR